MRSPVLIVSVAALVAGVFYLRPAPDLGSSPSVPPSLGTAGATELLNRQPGFFVPNLGQWDHAASFVHRSGSMTLFLEDRGWVIDIAERPAAKPGTDRSGRGVALRMTFEGDACVPEIVGEKKFEGHHNYFLGNDPERWRHHRCLRLGIRRWHGR